MGDSKPPGSSWFTILDHLLRGMPVERHGAYIELRRMIRNCLGAARAARLGHELEDFVHERLIDIARHYGEGRLREPTFPGFLRVLVQSRFLDWVKVDDREVPTETDPRGDPSSARTPDHETRLAVHTALGKLPTDQRMALLLKQEGFTLKESAGVLDMTMAQVNNRIKKAEHAMRRLLE